MLRKITKKESYIKTLDEAFKQAIEINREASFVDAAAGRYNEQNSTKIDTQINELDDSFQDCDINTMSTRSTNRSANGSFNGSFDRSIKQKQYIQFTITILPQISGPTVDTRATMKIAKTDKISTGTTIEREGTNRTHGTTREMGFRTGTEDRNRFDNRR